ncbi:hypothetical protein [Rhizobium sp. R635]|uniref:hypothetical protein n=1 Tax=unclassified Rhizobium TaxID=2613769 RepID=UPI00113003D6|nr:hypothetical protein [Rhizobium sp. R635]
MTFAFLSHAVFWHLRKMWSYRLETRTRKPVAARNIEYCSHVFARRTACFFGHVGNFMRPELFAALVRRRKFGKKLTNNFIILCELLRGAVQDSSHMKLSPPALAAKADF